VATNERIKPYRPILHRAGVDPKDIEQARNARRRALRADIVTRRAKVAEFLPQPQPAQQTRGKLPIRTKPKLSLYKEDRRS
jgi:hypothetical protein